MIKQAPALMTQGLYFVYMTLSILLDSQLLKNGLGVLNENLLSLCLV